MLPAFAGEIEPPESPSFQETLCEAEPVIRIVNSYLLLQQIDPPVGAVVPKLRFDEVLPRRPFDQCLVDLDLVQRMAQHCLCDGLHFLDLFAMASVLHEHPLGQVYEPIFRAIAIAMRTGFAAGGSNRETEWWLRSQMGGNTFEPDLELQVVQARPSSSKGPGRRWLKLAPSCLEAAGLPANHSYPLLHSLIGSDRLDGLKWSHLLYSLMAYLAHAPAARPKYETATRRLAELIPAYASRQTYVDGLVYGPKLAPVELSDFILALEWNNELLIGLANRDGGLSFQCYRPLCLNGCNYLRAFCIEPEEDGKVFFRENLWEYARDQHGNSYAQAHFASQGQTYRCPWEHGLGKATRDAEPPQHLPEPLSSQIVWTQLAVARVYGDGPGG